MNRDLKAGKEAVKAYRYLNVDLKKGEIMRTVTSTSLKLRQKQRHSVYVATTLYDVIEAVSAQVPSDENYLLTPAVLKLLQDCGAGSLFKGSA